MEYQKSRVRSKVEYVFLLIRRLFGYRKVRYRGIEKNTTHAFILGTCANLLMLAQSGWRMGIAASCAGNSRYLGQAFKLRSRGIPLRSLRTALY